MVRDDRSTERLMWMESAKSLALFGILLNHFIEEFKPGPWFTNPSNDWPDLWVRLQNIYPPDTGTPFLTFIQFLGWLGDSCPGVFILLSGFGLTWSYLKQKEKLSIGSFYSKRAIRIYPLYIAIHFFVLAGALFIPGLNISIASTKTFLSLLGLRFIPNLFFYIVPAWWFVWVIIQLYILFPFLIRLLLKQGIIVFLAATISFTILSRLYGVLYSDHLYYWMTGMFFGTRLAEFTLGMSLAFIMAQGEVHWDFGKILIVLLISAGIYCLGFVSSLFLYGTLMSNLLITAGLTGVFYCLWLGLVRKSNYLEKMMEWIGANAYGVFLLHQAPLIWAGLLLKGQGHIVAAIAVIGLSFPAAAVIQQGVSQWLPALFRQIRENTLAMSSVIASTIAMGVTFFIEPMLVNLWFHDAVALALGVLLLYLCVLEYHFRISRDHYNVMRWAGILSLMLVLFVFPRGNGFMAVAASVFIVFIAGLFHHFMKSRLKAFSASASVAAMVFVVLEIAFANCSPLERGQWGELPALEKHPTRTYSLKPNQKTRLRYNNYDYVVKTNSFGLASPEINPKRPNRDTLRILVIGDAFSMPEGLEYDKAYPALLEKILRKKLNPRTVQVINAGVTGYGPLQEFPQLLELLPIFKPDIVLYEYFINEFDDIRTSQANLLKEIGLTKSWLEKLNFVKNSNFLEHSRLFYLQMVENITGIPASWKYAKALLKFYEGGNNELYNAATISKMRKYIRGMNEACLNHGAVMIIYFVPGAVGVLNSRQISYFPRDVDFSATNGFDPERPLKEILAIAGPLKVPVVDLTEALKRDRKPTYFRESWHWNKEGHDVVAKEIARDLTERKLLEKKRD